MIRFADLHSYVGKFLGASGWTAINQTQTDQFAFLTGDDEWIHVDVDRATRELGGSIVHGYHLLSLIPFLHRQIIQIEGVSHGLNYGIDQLRFLHPVCPGDNLRLNETLLSINFRDEAAKMTIEARVEIEGKPRPAMVANCLFLLFPDATDRAALNPQIP